ncbi:MAG: hypothetical protein LBR69_06350 [Endomicrobium sp.]|jgi:hypothetical protein|nr:hypothetical protein [Endomicrobium sp.]
MNLIKTIIIIFILSIVFSIPVFAKEIKKDTDFFKSRTISEAQNFGVRGAIRINRFDGVNEFFVKDTGLLYTVNYDSYTVTTTPFSIPTTIYSTNSYYGTQDHRNLKISRDINNDVYVAGNVSPEARLSYNEGYDSIKKYTGNIEQWSITPRTTLKSCIEPEGLILSKNNDFLYAVYNNNGVPGGQREIYKINKQTGAYSVIYSAPMPTTSERTLLLRAITDEDDNIYLLSVKDGTKLVLQKIDSSGTQIFVKEFSGKSGLLVSPIDIQFLNNGSVFIVAEEGWEPIGVRNYLHNIVALLDKQGNIISNIIIDRVLDMSLGNDVYMMGFVGADESGIYYLFAYSNALYMGSTRAGVSRLIKYNYQNQVVQTLYLPGRYSADSGMISAYGWLDSIQISKQNPWREPFVKNKVLYVPYIDNYNEADRENTFRALSYNVDINNALTSLKYSDNANFVNKVSSPAYITKPDHDMTFRVKYKNFSEKAPISGFPRVHIYADGVPVADSPFPMSAVDPVDIDYAKGVDYSVSVKMICTAQTEYSYEVELTDGIETFNSDKYILPNYIPSKPIAISPNAVGEKVSNMNVDLEWLCGTSSVTYTLQMAGPYDNLTSTYSWVTKYSGSGTKHTSAQLELDKYYYWKVAAANSAGITEESEVFFFRAFDIPLPPVKVSPDKDVVDIIGAANVLIEWFCPTPNVTYSLKIAGPYDNAVSSYTWTEIYNGTGRYRTVPAEYGKHYYWKVLASNYEGDSAESDIFHFSTANIGKKAFNAPNPFNPARGQQTRFVFEMPESGTAQISLYSEYGDKVWESETFYKPSGQGFSEIIYDGKDNSGKALYNGTYLAVITKKYNGKTSVEKCRILVIK